MKHLLSSFFLTFSCEIQKGHIVSGHSKKQRKKVRKGFNVEMIELERSLSLTVWDVGGQEKMRTVWGCYCENTDGLVYVVDSTDKQRLEESRRQFEHILKNEHIKNVPVVLLANKQDMPGALTAEDITRMFKVKKLCSDRNWYVQPCCALTGDGLAQGFRKLTGFVKSHMKSRGDTLAFFKQNRD
nr:ADP-ribosylation factor-like protein 14 isoform X2 [Macaca fascicularis]